MQTERVAQKVERLGWYLPHMRLGFVHRQFQRGQQVPHVIDRVQRTPVYRVEQPISQAGLSPAEEQRLSRRTAHDS